MVAVSAARSSVFKNLSPRWVRTKEPLMDFTKGEILKQ